MNKLEILKIFCSVAETLHFRETANRLAISPQVVSRAINSLEKTLGETLFQRSTRQVKLTDFGEEFLPQAEQLISDTERLFSNRKLKQKEIAGIVRIAVPDIPLMQKVLESILIKAAAYPDLRIHWQARLNVEDVVNEQIDVGFRFGTPDDNRLIIRKVGVAEDCIVASPVLLARLGSPENWQALKKNYPLSALFNPNTGRAYAWYLSNQAQFIPSHPKFTATRMSDELTAVLQAQTIAFLPRFLCTTYLKSGELTELFPEIPRKQWTAYVYRPHRNVIHPRVKLVFNWLVESIEALLEEKK